MSWTSKLNDMLAVGGIKIHRVKHGKVLERKVSETAGVMVELFGTSGVGKSHFYRMLPREIKKKWHSRRSLFDCVETREDFSLLDEDEVELVETLLRWKYESVISQNMPLSRKVRLYDFFLKSMAADIIARKELLPICGVFKDDSLIKLYSKEVLRWYEQNNDKNDEMLKNFLHGRCIILIYAPDEYILENLKRRNAENEGKSDNDLIAHFGVDDAMNLTRKNRIADNHCLDVVKSLGVPILILEATEEKYVNQQKLINFLGSVSNSINMGLLKF